MTTSIQVALSLVFHCSPIAPRKKNKVTQSVARDPVAKSTANLLETWNSEDIGDFVRKLGLLDSQEETKEKIQVFLQLNEVASCAFLACMESPVRFIFSDCLQAT